MEFNKHPAIKPLFDLIDENSENIKVLQHQVEILMCKDRDRQIAELQASHATISKQISTLLKPLRHKFLDTFRYMLSLRDKDDSVYKHIGEIIKNAYKADAVSDTTLYLDGERTDIDTYYAVYGMFPRVVHELANEGYADAVHLINMHAGRKIKGEDIPDSLGKRYLDLLAAKHDDP